jgi:hypothetical protein
LSIPSAGQILYSLNSYGIRNKKAHRQLDGLRNWVAENTQSPTDRRVGLRASAQQQQTQQATVLTTTIELTRIPSKPRRYITRKQDGKVTIQAALNLTGACCTQMVRL